MDKNTFNKIKKRPFKRYKKLGQYLRQTADPYDYCQRKGANRHTKEEINEYLQQRRSYYKKLKKGKTKYYCYDEWEFSQDVLDAHLKAHSPLDYTHYTLRPDSLYYLFTLDIDPQKQILIQEFQPAIDFLQMFVPTTFWDHGSSGHSLNYYTWMYMGNLYEKVLNSFDNLFFDYLGDNYCYFVNTIKDILSAALQVILLSNFPDIFLENIYPDVSEYEYYIKSSPSEKINKYTGEIKQYTSHKTYYQKLTKNAHLMKLPHPKDEYQKEQLRAIPVLNIEEVLSSVCRYISLFYQSFSFSSFPPEISAELSEYAYLLCQKIQALFGTLTDSDTIELKALKEAHSEISSLRSEFLRILKSDPREKNPSGSNHIYDLLYTYMSPRFYVESENTVIERINSDPNAYNRSISFLHYLCWRTYVKEERDPTEDEYISLYRQYIGTGLETKENRKRLMYVYRKGIPKFNPEKIKRKLPYLVGEYMDQLKKEITPEKIMQIRSNKSSYDRPLTYEDIDIGAGWIYFSLTNEKYLAKKKEGRLEFTVPANSLSGFHNALNEKGLVQKRGTRGKAKAVKEILLHLGWIEYLDDDYCPIEHRSMRYILTEKHPRYEQFEKIIGKAEIEKWKQWREERNGMVVKKSA